MNPILEYQKIKYFILFCQKLKNLLVKGISLQTALKILIKDETNDLKLEKLQKIEYYLNQGQDFFQAIQEILPNSACFLTKVKTFVDLNLLLTELQNYYQEKLNSLNSLKKQIIYPATLAGTSLLGIFLFLFFILPLYLNFYSEMSLTLPSSIQYLIWAISYLKANFWLIISLVILGLFLGLEYLRPKLVKFIQQFFFPFNCSDLCFLIIIFLKNGFSLKQSLDLIKEEVVKDNKFIDFYQKFSLSGIFGENFSEVYSLTNYQKELLKIGESSSSLVDALQSISLELKNQEKEKLTKLIKIIPIFMLIFLGLLIFCFIYLTFLPLISSIQGIN